MSDTLARILWETGEAWKPPSSAEELRAAAVALDRLAAEHQQAAAELAHVAGTLRRLAGRALAGRTPA